MSSPMTSLSMTKIVIVGKTYKIPSGWSTALMLQACIPSGMLALLQQQSSIDVFMRLMTAACSVSLVPPTIADTHSLLDHPFSQLAVLEQSVTDIPLPVAAHAPSSKDIDIYARRKGGLCDLLKCVIGHGRSGAFIETGLMTNKCAFSRIKKKATTCTDYVFSFSSVPEKP